MEKIYLSPKEIIKLKTNLMQKKTRKIRSHSGSSLSSAFYKMQNKEIGKNFETNIKQFLEIYYEWKKLPLEEKIFYRKIEYKEKIELVTNIKPKKILIKNLPVLFQLNPNKSLDIIIKNSKVTIKNQEHYEMKLLGETIKIHKPIELEMDGIYENLKFENLNKQEIAFIKSNIHNYKLTDFKRAILEIKLNKEKITELLEQLQRDREFMNFFDTDNNYLYIGIINSNSANFKKIKEFIERHRDLNFIILGIKNCRFAGKDVTKFYDFEEIKKLKKSEEKNQQLEKKNKKLERRIKKLEKSVFVIKKKLQENKELLVEIKRFLMKKRERDEESTETKK